MARFRKPKEKEKGNDKDEEVQAKADRKREAKEEAGKRIASERLSAMASHGLKRTK